MALTFETRECSRCGGSGRYSFNQIHGDMCYGCHGKGRQMTKRGIAAREIWMEIARPTIPVTDVKPGMKLYVEGWSKRGAAEVESIENDDLNPGQNRCTIRFVQPAVLGSLGTFWNSTVQLAKTAESHRAAWDAVKDHPGVVTVPDKPAA